MKTPVRFTTATIALGAASAVVLAFGCSSPSNDDAAPATSPPPTARADSAPGSGLDVVTVHGELGEDFRSLSDITSASTAIIVGTVLEARPNPYRRVAFTVSKVRVDEAIKGEPLPGDEIAIVEWGGIIAVESKLEPGTFGPPYERAVEGVRVMAVGEQWLLFLGPYDPGPVATNAYHVLGVFQGKTKVQGDGALKYTGPAGKLDDLLFTVPASLDGRSVDDVVAELKEVAIR